MQNYAFHKPIEITRHTWQRIEERVVNHDGFKDWQHMVKKARYEGRSVINMTDEEYKWYSTHISHLDEPSIPFEVRRHIRTLPEGWKASPGKIVSAFEYNIILTERQTWVDSYTKGGNVA